MGKKVHPAAGTRTMVGAVTALAFTAMIAGFQTAEAAEKKTEAALAPVAAPTQEAKSLTKITHQKKSLVKKPKPKPPAPKPPAPAPAPKPASKPNGSSGGS